MAPNHTAQPSCGVFPASLCLLCLQAADTPIALQAHTPPRTHTPPPANGGTPHPDGGGGTGFGDPSSYSGLRQQYGGSYIAASPQGQLSSPSVQQQEHGDGYAGINGVPAPSPQQQYYSPPAQMQPGHGPTSATSTLVVA